MAGQMAALSQGLLSRSDLYSSSSSVSSFMGGGRYSCGESHVTVVRGRRSFPVGCGSGSLAQRSALRSDLGQTMKHAGKSKWEGRNPRRRWCAQSSLNSLATESSSSEESASASVDSEEGAPMRKSNFVAKIQRVLRLIAGFLKNFSPYVLLKGFLSFLRGPGRRQVLFLSVVSSTVGLLYLCTTLTGIASPQVVPYSDLVNHLRSKSVTTALFEEGSSHLYFNLKQDDVNTIMADNHRDTEQASAARDSKEVTTTITSPQTGFVNLRVPGAEGGRDLYRHVSTMSKDSLVPRQGTTSYQKVSKGASQKWKYATRRIKNDEAFLLPLMRDAGVKYSSAPQSMSSAFKTVLITVITLWIPLSPLLWVLHRQMSQNGGNAKKKRNVIWSVKFEDVAGVDVAKAELMEIVDCMRGATKFSQLGAKVPKGVLLVGPPGTGKTLLARAVAGEAGVPFFAASASEFVEMFVGRGAARIRELFAEARKNTPSIVFIDELDAVGGRRGRSFNDERDQTLNQLLTEMDGFESDMGVLVIAATNRPEALDPALCRPGRLSRRVHVTEPDLQGRQQVLAVHMRGVPVEEDALLLQRLVASMTSGFVGADLANLVNEAALLAARKGRSSVIFEDFKEAVDRVKYGVGDRNRNLLNVVEQKLGSWFSTLSPEASYPTFPSSG